MSITDDGFEGETLRTILARVEQRQRVDVDPEIDTDPESVVGQLNGILSRELALAWEALEAAYDGTDPRSSTGNQLEGIALLSGTTKRAAAYTTQVCSCDIDAGTTLISGTHFAEVSGNPASRWTPEADYTATASGSQPVTFRAEFAGPVTLADNSLTVIATALAGWNSITNGTTPEVVGYDADDDDTLRLRREADIARTGSATAAAIRADVLAADEAIQSVSVFTNRTDDTDGSGLPPHSFEVLVSDGGGADNDAIAQAIYNTACATDGIYGSTSGNATDPATGETIVVPFTRPTEIQIYITATVTGSVVAAEVEEYIAEQASALAVTGANVRWRQIDSLAFGFTGVTNVTDFAIGTAPAPGSAVDIPIGEREIATYDAARVSVTVA